MSWIKTAQRVDFLDGDLPMTATRSRGVDRSRAGQSCAKDQPCSPNIIQAKLNESTRPDYLVATENLCSLLKEMKVAATAE